MIGNLDNYLRFNETALSLRSQRQELLASNIANADTPNYKARDIDFASALQNAMAGGKSGAALNTTSSNHLARGAASEIGLVRSGTASVRLSVLNEKGVAAPAVCG